MIAATARLLERYFNLRYDQTVTYLNRVVVSLAALAFILLATLIVAFDDVTDGRTGLSSLQMGDIAPSDIFAPESRTYVSQVLTQQRREAAAAGVSSIYAPPNPEIARQQTDLAGRILNFIDNVRRSAFDTVDQKTRDIEEITALALDRDTIRQLLELDNETWQDVSDQVIAVLERVMRADIRETNLPSVRAQIPNQVGVRFSEIEAQIIVAIVGDLTRPNSFPDEEATQAAREDAAAGIPDETRSFERGQIVVSGGTRIGPADFEALQQLGLLRTDDRRVQGIIEALLGSTVVMVIVGLYIARFEPVLLYREPRLLTLLAAIFLFVLVGARLGLNGEVYIYPTSALALIYVAIQGPHSAVIGTLGLAFLVGLMANNSLEFATLVAVGGIIGGLTLRRSERLNSYFFAGLMVAISNMAVAALFNLGVMDGTNATNLALLVIYSLLNGILTAAAAMAGMYIITLLFNLPTALKLVELSQPNQPLLQRLLREAPGTYQHSLQVGNLSEQAANAIGANAELTHVAALYHDIGKMLNLAFFTENQRDISNPHDTLNDPYRSADIIIGHVTGGDEMAKHYRLPNRIRDFIREHHGTSEVFVFYQQALILAGDDESMVDPDDFRYPGPRPQSRETAIMMLADSCEAAVRSRQPKNNQEIEETVRSVIDGKRKAGQLDESGLTLSDLKTIQDIYIDMLQATFHPRINYTEAIAKARQARDDEQQQEAASGGPTVTVPEAAPSKPAPRAETPEAVKKPETPPRREERPAPPVAAAPGSANPVQTDDDDAPLPEVPRLRRAGETRQANMSYNNNDDKSQPRDEPASADEPAQDAAHDNAAHDDAAHDATQSAKPEAADENGAATTEPASEDRPARQKSARRSKDKGEASS